MYHHEIITALLAKLRQLRKDYEDLEAENRDLELRLRKNPETEAEKEAQYWQEQYLGLARLFEEDL